MSLIILEIIDFHYNLVGHWTIGSTIQLIFSYYQKVLHNS